MRAVRFVGDRRVQVDDVDTPVPGPGELRVRLDGCGVCGSNLPVWEGRPWFTYPLEPGAPGHEGWGIVDAAGPLVDESWAGRRVAMISAHAYAEWDLAPVEAVAVVPDALANEPCPGEPLACAVNVIERAGVHPGDTVVIVGIGFLGAALTALACDAGAFVLAISRRPFARDLARSLGAADTAAPAGARECVATHTGGRMADCVIEAVGLQESLDIATDLTTTRGRLVIAGYHQDGRRTVNMQLWNWRGLDVINAHERDTSVYVSGMRRALDLAAEGRLPIDRLVTHRHDLDEIDQAFALMAERPQGFLKSVVTCR